MLALAALQIQTATLPRRVVQVALPMELVKLLSLTPAPLQLHSVWELLTAVANVVQALTVQMVKHAVFKESGRCTSTSQCKTNARCAGVQCINSNCVVNNSLLLDCTTTSTPICNTLTSSCQQCLVSTDCSGSTTFCVTGTCVACQADTDCRSNSDCNAVCVSGSCTHLGSTLQCTSPNVCNLAAATCSQCTGNSAAACDQDSSCGLVCGGGRCGGVGVPCGGSTPHCSGGVCSQCKTTAQCGKNQLCAQSKCVPCTSALCPTTGSVSAVASLFVLLVSLALFL